MATEYRVNVKRHDMHRWAEVPGATDGDYEAAYEGLSYVWWYDTAPAIAEQHGGGEVYQEGRSGGWAVVELPDTADSQAFADDLIGSMPGEQEWIEAVTEARDRRIIEGFNRPVCQGCGAIQ